MSPGLLRACFHSLKIAAAGRHGRRPPPSPWLLATRHGSSEFHGTVPAHRPFRDACVGQDHVHHHSLHHLGSALARWRWWCYLSVARMAAGWHQRLSRCLHDTVRRACARICLRIPRETSQTRSISLYCSPFPPPIGVAESRDCRRAKHP